MRRPDGSLYKIRKDFIGDIPEDVAASRECGMNGHLAKPLDIPQLIERMDYWLHNPAG